MTPEVAASTDTDISRMAASWRVLNGRIRSTLAELPTKDFALEARPRYWPIWAIAGHLAGTRVYWVCMILKQPGIEGTHFPAPIPMAGKIIRSGRAQR